MKRMIIFLLVMALVAGTMACSPDTAPAADESAQAEASTSEASGQQGEAAETIDLYNLKISSHPSPMSLPNFLGIEKGWFGENGLAVENTTYISGAPQLEAVNSGVWDVGFCGIIPPLAGVPNYDLKILGISLWDDPHMGLVVRNDSKICQSGQGNIPGYPEIYGKPEDWKGATIICTQGTNGHVLLASTLNAMGLSLEDVTILHMEIQAGSQAFYAGEADAIAQWTTFTYDSISRGGYTLASTPSAVGLEVPTVILATRSIVEEHPEVVQAYMDTVIKGLDWIADPANFEEMEDIYYNMCLDEGVATTEEVCNWMLSINRVPTIDEMESMFEVGDDGQNGYERCISYIMDFMISAGTHTEEQKTVLMENIDLSFLEQALKNYKGE